MNYLPSTISVRQRSLNALAALTLIVLTSSQAVAVFDPATDFNIDISAYEATFLSPNGTPHSCGDPILELLAHTSPFVRVTNTSSMTIDQVTVTVGNADYHFSPLSTLDPMFVRPGMLSDQTAFSSSVSALGNGSLVDNDLLTVGFTGGLAPNETAIFQIMLAPDDLSTSPAGLVDYRQVMLAGADPALFTISGDGMVSPAVSADNSLTPLMNEAIGFSRGPGSAAPTTVFEINAATVTIPEPASALLALVAAAGMAAGRRRQQD